MKKLTDIPKENIFKVPEGYFEHLPDRIQSRIAKPDNVRWLIPALKVAMPIAAMLVIGAIWWNSRDVSVEEQLNAIETEQLVAYIDEWGLPYEWAEDQDWTETELNDLEETVYSDMEWSRLPAEELLELEMELKNESENK